MGREYLAWELELDRYYPHCIVQGGAEGYRRCERRGGELLDAGGGQHQELPEQDEADPGAGQPPAGRQQVSSNSEVHWVAQFFTIYVFIKSFNPTVMILKANFVFPLFWKQ